MADSQETTRTALVCFATETGTAQDLADETAVVLERLKFSVDVQEADTIAIPSLRNYDLIVFSVSTTGQGDFPANARKFWTSLLRKKLGPTTLDDVKYALVGLGDSSYPKFNFAARKLDKRLHQLGAERLLDSCEADEQDDDSTDGAFIAWLPLFRNAVLQYFPLSDGNEALPDDVDLPPKWRLERQYPESNGCLRSGAYIHDGATNYDERPLPAACLVTLKSNARLTPSEHWQDVRLLTLETPKRLEYFPGDALAILPKNSRESVNTLVEHLKWTHDADIPIRLVPTAESANLSTYRNPPLTIGFFEHSTSLREVLTNYLDINAIPRRSFFARIARYTTNAMHKERLLEFTQADYLDEYYDYATRPRRSILEILQEFDSVKIPWQEAVNVIPALRPRQFSIASGGKLKYFDGGTRFELLVAIVKYRTIIKRIREGVCTRYLASLAVGSTLQVVVKTEGRFYSKLNQMLGPKILIGPGTGVAPLRALIYEEHLRLGGMNQQSAIRLFYGSRNQAADYFFRKEWEKLATENDGRLQLIVNTAFSRDQPQKVYVQDSIREASLVVREMILQGAAIIVCGSSGSMPKAVREAIVCALCSDASMTRRDAEGLLSTLETQGRYKQETWS